MGAQAQVWRGHSCLRKASLVRRRLASPNAVSISEPRTEPKVRPPAGLLDTATTLCRRSRQPRPRAGRLS